MVVGASDAVLRCGARNLLTDVAGIRVGNATDRDLKSGVTVVVSDVPFSAAVDVRGGAPGSRETDLLGVDKLVQQVDALVLAGGSAYGLDAASGVTDVLRESGRGFAVGPARVPLVPSAILFDLLNGGRKDWTRNPYRELGDRACRAALQANIAQTDGANFELGSAGAGCGATTANLKGGLGSASLQLPDGTTVAALMAVNPHGSVNTGDAGHFWAAPFEMNNEFGGLGGAGHADATVGQQVGRTALPVPVSDKLAAFQRANASAEPVTPQGSNTTIGIIATDADLTRPQLQRLAVAGHDGLARAIVPAHTPYDGDLLFALATAQRGGGSGSASEAMSQTQVDPVLLGHAAAICVSRAIARAVYLAAAEPGDVLPSWRSLYQPG